MSIRWQQVAGWSGILFAVLTVVGGLALAPQPPGESDSVPKIVSFYAHHRTGLLVQGYVFGISWVAFLIFLAGLRQMVRTSEVWGALAIVAGATWLTLNVASQAIITSLSDRVAKDFPGASTMVGMHDLTVALFTFSFFAVAALTLAVSYAGLELGVVGRRLSWFGLAVAAVSLVTSLGIIWPSNGALYALLVVAYLLYVVWVAWASVSMRTMRTHDSEAGEPAREPQLARV